MSNNAKVGGILSIIAGAIGAAQAAMFLFIALFFGWAFSNFDYYGGSPYYTSPPESAAAVFFAIWVGFALFFAALSVLAIVGGILAIKRQHFGWALAGSIAGLFTFFPCGIPAIVFVSMGKSEFAPSWGPPSPPPAPPPPPPTAASGS